eukprot:3937166-Rhodomonas_salina.1
MPETGSRSPASIQFALCELLSAAPADNKSKDSTSTSSTLMSFVQSCTFMFNRAPSPTKACILIGPRRWHLCVTVCARAADMEWKGAVRHEESKKGMQPGPDGEVFAGMRCVRHV